MRNIEEPIPDGKEGWSRLTSRLWNQRFRSTCSVLFCSLHVTSYDIIIISLGLGDSLNQFGHWCGEAWLSYISRTPPTLSSDQHQTPTLLNTSNTWNALTTTKLSWRLLISHPSFHCLGHLFRYSESPPSRNCSLPIGNSYSSHCQTVGKELWANKAFQV